MWIPLSIMRNSLFLTLALDIEMVPDLQTCPSPETRFALQELVDRYRDCPDFRLDNQNKSHQLVDILVSAICAVLGGANSWVAVERFGLTHEAWLRRILDLPEGIPSHDTYRRVFMILDPEEMNSRFSTWIRDISEGLPLNQVAFDGKTMCGSGGGRTSLKALHIVHAFATEQGVCLGQQAVDTKSNEITAIPELLKLLDLKGALVSIDAMGCQKEIAANIVERGADYLLAVKGNQEHLYQDVQQSLAPIITNPSPVASEGTDHAQTEEMNRGRWERRTCYLSTDLSKIRDKKLWKG